MSPLTLRASSDLPAAGAARRRRFGLDAPLPADRTIVARGVLRHLAEARPTVVVLPLTADDEGSGGQALHPAAGVPDLLLLAPGGRAVFVRVKTQAEVLPRAHRAFADLCRGCGVPLVVVRSLPEARDAFDRLKL